MGILNDIGSGLGDVAHAVTNAPQEIAALPGAIASGAQALGHAAVQTLGKPLPTFVADPNTGQVVQQGGAPTVGHMVGNILTGALGGLAGSRPGQNFGEALGSGYAASQMLQQQRQKQQFTQAMQNLRQADVQKYQNAVIHLQDQKFAAMQKAEAQATKLKWHTIATNTVNTLTRAGAIPMATLGGNLTLAQFQAQDPEAFQKYAKGQYYLVWDPGAGTTTVLDVSTLRSAPIPITVDSPGKDGGPPVSKTATVPPMQALLTLKHNQSVWANYFRAQGLAEKKHYDDGRLGLDAKRGAAVAANAVTLHHLQALHTAVDQSAEMLRQAKGELVKMQGVSGANLTPYQKAVTKAAAAYHGAVSAYLGASLEAPSAPQPQAAQPSAFNIPVKIRLSNGMTGTLAAGAPMPAGAQRIQ